jgi:hypothetical protein
VEEDIAAWQYKHPSVYFSVTACDYAQNCVPFITSWITKRSCCYCYGCEQVISSADMSR